MWATRSRPPRPGQPDPLKRDFAVAAGHALTADAAAEAVRAGGTAVDAVVAGALMSTVAEPVLSGLLGGGFLMVHEPRGAARLLDFFVQTPARKISRQDLDFRAIEARFGTASQEFHIGAGTIAVPGVVPGLAEAHERYGRIPFRDLASPAARAARDGVEVTRYQSDLFRIVEAILVASPEVRAIFCDDDSVLSPGALWKNPALADVIATLAVEGPRFVTEGEVAAALLAATANGGHLTAWDLKSYAPVWRDPLSCARAGARVRVNPPPSLGGALVSFALQAAPQDPDLVHLVRTLSATAEARIETLLDRAPGIAVGKLLDPGLLARYRAEIREAPRARRGTTHISVIDRSGMGAAMTLSNGEGSGLIAPGTGIMPNNMMGEADLLPEGFDAWQPGRRLSSMMAPLTVDWPDGRMAMLGSGGSNRIRSALAQVLIALIDRDAHLADAIEAPRAHVEPGEPEAVDFEDVAGEANRAAILAHWPQTRAWPERSMFFGGVHGVMREASGGLAAAGDPRRAGVAIRG